MKKYSDHQSAFGARRMIEAIDQIAAYLKNKSYVDFKNDPLLQDAVFYRFSVISAQIREVDRYYLDRYDFPWYQVKAFQMLMHNPRFDIRLSSVWSMIKNNFPELRKVLGNMMKHEFPNRPLHF